MAKNILWEAEKRSYEKIYTGVTGNFTRVRDTEQEGAIAYTTEDGNIYLSEINELNKDLNPVYQRVFRKGVFTHEMLHQIFTNFKMENRIIKNLPERERKIYALINNALEDPAIEYFAPTVVGGHLIRSLRYAIALTYDLSPDINESDTAFGQWFNAMIQFGDMGYLKGEFTFPEAKETFRNTIKMFNDGIEEPSGAKRCQISKDLMEATRPLWEEDMKNQEEFEKMMKKIMDMLEEMGKSPMGGSGSGIDADGEGEGESKKSSRRKKVIEVSPEEFEEMMKHAKPGKGSGDTIIKVKGDKKNKEKSKDGKGSENGDGDGKDSSKSESSSDETEYNTSSDNDGEYSAHANKEGTGRIKPGGSDGSDGYDDGGIREDINKDLILSDEELSFIEEESKKSLDDYNIELTKNGEDDSSIPNFNIESPRLRPQRCLNYRIGYEGHSASQLERDYAKAVSELAGGIKSITVQLKRIFQNDCEEKQYRTSGKLNLQRINNGRVTPRVFDRRKGPVEKNDLAVFLLVDESGSMSYGNKAYAASRCAITLAEVFNNLNVPIYVMGFTANTEGYDVVHNHYITWKNNYKDRIKLLNIAARANNTDGYSIRYATKILDKSKAKNKLLIVISDGQPASNCYHGSGEGVADTKDAIREAKKKVSVLGVAVGDSDTEAIYYMYEKDFLHVSNIQELYSNLAKKVKDIIKGWN